MAFALTGFKASGIRHTCATRSHGEQIAIFSITGANTDVDLDISDSAGTFWTAAAANTTYGSIATAAAALFFGTQGNTIASAVQSLVAIEAAAILPYAKVLSLTAGNQFTVAITTDLPDLLFNSGSAPTAYTLILRWLLVDGIEPVAADFGAALT